jgi:hypothetical protein
MSLKSSLERLPRKRVRSTSFDHNSDAAARRRFPRQDHGYPDSTLQGVIEKHSVVDNSEIFHSKDVQLFASSQAPASATLKETHFAHQPLRLDTPSIRLISVEVPKADGTISCTIRHVSLEPPPASNDVHCLPPAGTFTCLSYVWGSCESMREILVNEKRFRVRLNLWGFLSAVSSMRAQEEYRHSQTSKQKEVSSNQGHMSWGPWYQSLWIDALCINQENSSERNHQVQQMGRIYSSATRVLAWLGDSPSLVSLVKVFENNKLPYRSSGRPYLPGSDFPGMKELHQNPYWERAWVVQEILLAQELWFHAQDSMISVFELRRAVSAMNHEELDTQALVELVNRVKSYRPIGSYLPTRLIENIEVFRQKKCSDARDRVFSLLTVSGDGAELIVDYESSLLELARSVLRLSGADICICSAFIVVEALGLAQNLPDLDVASPFIASTESATLDSMTPCVQCWGNAGYVPPGLLPPDIADISYVCLHCNHSKPREPLGSHLHCHVGHLCIMQCESSAWTDNNLLLYWIPMGGGTWRKLESFKYVTSSREGEFQSLTLSIGIICELMSLVNVEEENSGGEKSRFLDGAYSSAWMTTWTVAEQRGMKSRY